MKELTESPPTSAFRARFEAGRSFDLDDDLEFCPGLLTEDDVSSRPSPLNVAPTVVCDQDADDGYEQQLHSIHSSSSDGSMSSGSPQSSPLQHQIQPQQQHGDEGTESSVIHFARYDAAADLRSALVTQPHISDDLLNSCVSVAASYSMAGETLSSSGLLNPPLFLCGISLPNVQIFRYSQVSRKKIPDVLMQGVSGSK
ncbi:MAG: hypothetical protein Q9207_004616 [Kuettlingeria erythrocarpa]